MKLLETIEQVFCQVNQPRIPELEEIIRSLKLTPELLSPWIEAPAQLPYGRRVMYQSPGVEVVLVHLPPGSATYIHDHGEARGCAYVVEGVLTNLLYRVTEAGYACETGSMTVTAGAFLYAPQGQIHQMLNSGAERLVTFHAYTPRLRDTKRYYTYEQVLDYVI